MVRAILAGTKTQTRRVVTHKHGTGDWASVHKDGSGLGWIAWAPSPGTAEETVRLYPGDQGFRCPYGVPGDRLWVREGHGFTATVPVSAHHRCLRDGFAPQGWLAYRADKPVGHWCWRPSIHMPRWASRITLEVTEVRVQRVQDITEEDAKAEGCGGYVYGHGPGDEGALRVEPGYHHARFFRAGFENVWDSINAKRAPWASNPWVWAVSFRRVE